LSSREVEDLSYEIAMARQDMRYWLSRSWVTDIENGKYRPSVLKLRALSLIYQCDYDEFLVLFGIPISEAARDEREHEGLLLPHTHLLDAKEPSERTIIAPTELRGSVDWEKTNLVARMFSEWGEVPVRLLEHMDLRNCLYGYIGKKDYTMFPIIRPASFVQIDQHQRRIGPPDWHHEHDRPIYFFELRDRYVCSWCELHGSQLILIPSPQSGLSARPVLYPGDVEILGRVTGLTMRIAETVGPQPKPSPRSRSKSRP
jgi:transcriptional regulator with XRE-family HTH domain